MGAVTFKCPNCGGDLRFDPATQKYKCEYCASLFDQAQLEAANQQAQKADAAFGSAEQKADANQTDHTEATDESDIADGTGTVDGAHTNAQGAVVYTCPSCGAEIVTDATTAATFCYYCHNPVVLQGKLSGEYEPDLVIPFAVDKKEAVDSFLKYVKSKKFVPRDFFCKEQIEKITGVYFPFWSYSCDADGSWQGTGNQTRVYCMGDIEYTETKVFDVERRADFDFHDMMRDALDKENQQLVDAVQPFNPEGAKPFSMAYLSGFQAEKRNIEKTQMINELKQEVEHCAQEMLKGSVSGYMATQTNHAEVQVRSEDWKYLMLPVWVLTYKGSDDKIYYYAMNGQTKKISGVLPMDKKRLMGLFFGVFFGMFLFLLLFIVIGEYFL